VGRSRNYQNDLFWPYFYNLAHKIIKKSIYSHFLIKEAAAIELPSIEFAGASDHDLPE
jgi:hypothetical protein